MLRQSRFLVFVFAVACGGQDASPPAAGTPTRVPAGPSPTAVAAADLNGDGRLDLLVANGSGDVTVLLGDGSGGFAMGSRFPAGPNPSGIAAVDFDRDARTDSAVANHETSLVTILLGDGTGRFTAARGSPFDTGSRPHVHNVAVADVDGDGDLDIAVDSVDTNSVQVLWGNGPAAFLPPMSYAAGLRPYYSVGAGELTGDRLPDLAVGNSGDGTVSILTTDGRGGLRAAPGSPHVTGLRSPFGIAVGDVSGDGRGDIVVLGPGEERAAVLRNEGGGVFAAVPGSPFSTGRGPSHAALGDIDADGVLDIAVSNASSNDVTLLLSAPGRSVASARRTVATGRSPGGLAVADLNRDGRADLAVANSSDNDLTVWLSR